MPLFTPFGFYKQFVEEVIPPSGPIFYPSYDAFSGSLYLAIPAAEFNVSGSQMSNWYDDISAEIRGTGTSFTANPTGSAGEIDEYTTSTQWTDYSSSLYVKDAGTWGNLSTTELPFAANSWVVEGYVYMDERFTKPPYWKVGLRNTSNNVSAELGFPGTGTTDLKARIMINGSQFFSSDTNISYNLNQWYHVAWVRSGSNLYFYFDGTRYSCGTTALTSNTTGVQQIMGGASALNDGAAGAWQDFRTYIGTDKGYTTATITPPAQMLISTAQDEDAVAFFHASGLSDTTQCNAVNQLVVDLKDAGLWTKLKAIYPFVGGTASTHKWNLKDPQDTNAAYRLTFSGGITHSSNGIKGNGTTGYYNTYMAHNTLGQNNASMFVYIRDNIAEDRVDMGMLDTAAPYTGFQINARSTSNVITARMNDSTLSTVANTDARGLIGISRLSSTSYSISKDTTQTSKSVTSTGTKTRQIFGLCFNLNGSPGFYTTRQQAFASLGDGLTDAEIDDLYTVVQTYQTALGRNV